jgi:hypothetical protein
MSTENEYSKYDGMTLVQIIESMSTIQKAKERLEDELKLINKEFDFLRITKVPAKMEEDGVDRITVAGVGRVSLTADMHVSVKADMKEKFYEWLRDNGRGDLLQETVNASTLKAAVKGMYKNGEEIPDTMLNVSPFTRASITKA